MTATATASRAGTSRASSLRPASAARAIQKRRDKPYKTEQSRIIAKKRKLHLHTTYTNAPSGFTFLPVGTPDLAERCKEISRQRGLPVNVVNVCIATLPRLRRATPPAFHHHISPSRALLIKTTGQAQKVSHHIHRIGYHFRSDVVEDACQQLGYIPNRGRFVKEAELADENEKSRMARAMAKHGIIMDEPAKQETDEQVRAAVKELFPRIPEEDLQAILQHAWAEGSQRVGTNSTIELPRRVQLATIARIRHTYTDYDRLLRAFEWKEARQLVEPTCLKKLIEWRGENDEETDNELEEIVRETIVIDDDDDDPSVRNGSEADDEDSTAGLDQGYASDTSVEISHEPAGAEDLGAESHDERSRRFLDRFQPAPRNVQQRYMDVRQKIGAMREQLRNGPPAAESNVVRVHVPESKTGDDTILIGGQLYRRAPAPGEALRSPVYQVSAHSSPQSIHGYPHYPAQPQTHELHQQRYPIAAAGHGLQDRPVASIEPPDDLRRMAIASASAKSDTRSNGHHSRPESPSYDSPGKRRRVEQPRTDRFVVNPYQAQPPSPIGSGHFANAQPSKPLVGVMTMPYQPSPPQTDRGSPFADAAVPSRADLRPSTYVPPGLPEVNGSTYRPMQGENRPLADVSYDPRQPMMQQNERYHSAVPQRQPQPRHGFVDAQVAPIQYVPLLPQGQDQYGRPTYARVPAHDYHRSGHQTGQPPHRVVYVEAPRQYTPVHGAPAAVQQLPRAVPNGAYKQQPSTAAPVTVPAYAPVAGQQQYYYPR
ncbi:hypothetical protein AC578_4526 [Pseudocercospora eumusae]|uniref:DUF2293 domain-containing protein n=1 Tax=Pseudocercospora eumusae TaxID=321146 RepID=A0A139HGE1_9PEZI|nr:hypothetical protein AC578_4526 [Pseudocercospora eumusae]